MAANGAKIKSPSHGARERKKNITVEEKKVDTHGDDF